MADVESVAQQLSNLRMVTRQKAEGEVLLAKRGLQVGDDTVPHMLPGKNGTDVPVRSNIFPVKMNRKIPIYMYHVDIDVIFETKSGVEKAKKCTMERKNDVFSSENRSLSSGIVNYVVKHASIFPTPEHVSYDMCRILYSLDKLESSTGEVSVHMNRKDCPGDDWPLNESFTGFRVSLQYTERIIFLGEEYKAEAGKINLDRTLQSCLDVITSQGIFHDKATHIAYENGKSYLYDPYQYGFSDSDMPQLGNGAYVGIGCSKSVRLVKSDSGVIPSLVIETKKTPFHVVQNLAQKALTMFPNFNMHNLMHMDVLRSTFKNLVVFPTHTKARYIQIREVYTETANDTTFQWQGGPITVTRYFKERYNIALRFPDLPLVLFENREKQKMYYPMEVLEVADNQRVGPSALSGNQVAQLIKVCAIPPRTLENQIYSTAKSLNLFNPHCKAAGVEVVTQPIVAAGRQLRAPGFVYAEKQVSQYDMVKFNWRPGRHYFNPATVRRWACYAMEAHQSFDLPNLKRFADAFGHECRNRGMQMTIPSVVQVLQHEPNCSELRNLFEQLRVNNCDFVILITTKEDTRIHGELKKAERICQIITQNITSSVAADAIGMTGPPKRLTMENLVNKANIKNGGLNYLIGNLDTRMYVGDHGDLFIGFATNHPAGGLGEVSTAASPSVVGYAANDIKDPCAFTGDYMYQEPRRDEKFRVIEDIVGTVLKRYSTNRGSHPKRVFIYRNGCSEGQFEMILKFEIPLIKSVIASVCGAKLVFVVANKLHNVRLYPTVMRGTKPQEQNLQPGVVVDKDIVSPNVTEFYCIGHAARMGTAKIPKYSVLDNSANVSMDELQELTYHLCFGHQIISGSTSLPSPIFIANRYSERGRLNYNFYTSDSSSGKDNEKSSSNSQSNSSGSGSECGDQYAILNQKITICNKDRLRNVRFNA